MARARSAGRVPFAPACPSPHGHTAGPSPPPFQADSAQMHATALDQH